MTEQNPFVTDPPLGGPSAPTAADITAAQPSTAEAAGVADDIAAFLDLDAFLSGDIKLAETVVHIYIRPDLEAKIEELHAELADLVDDNGRPLNNGDEALGEGGRSAITVATELEQVQAEYAASRRGILLRQMPSDDWQDFRTRHREALATGEPYPDELWDEMVLASAARPAFTPEKLAAFHKRVGSAQMERVRAGAWDVNRQSGVSVPKSPLSSRVLRFAARERS